MELKERIKKAKELKKGKDYMLSEIRDIASRHPDEDTIKELADIRKYIDLYADVVGDGEFSCFEQCASSIDELMHNLQCASQNFSSKIEEKFRITYRNTDELKGEMVHDHQERLRELCESYAFLDEHVGLASKNESIERYHSFLRKADELHKEIEDFFDENKYLGEKVCHKLANKNLKIKKRMKMLIREYKPRSLLRKHKAYTLPSALKEVESALDNYIGSTIIDIALKCGKLAIISAAVYAASHIPDYIADHYFSDMSEKQSSSADK